MTTTSSFAILGARRRPRPAVAVGMSGAERRWLLWPPLIFFGVALGLPLFALVLQAFETGGQAWADMWGVAAFPASLMRTIVMAVVVTCLAIVLGTAYSFAIVASPTWLRYTLLAALILSLWTSIMVRSFGWMLLELPKGAIWWFLNALGLREEPIELYQTTIGMY
ncbi:MAG TPA: hypothetical protein VF477_11705, partial [Mycobacterium sp.]